jgi:copper transport protein
LKIRLVTLVFAFLLAVWGLTAVTKSASAHAYLQRSEPADGARLTQPPEIVQLWFDEPIAPAFSTVQVFNSTAARVLIGDIHTNPTDPYQLSFSFTEVLPEGVYSVLWRALSEADGHLSYGMLVFGVGEQIDLNAASITDNSTPPPTLTEIMLRWLNFVMLGGLVGGLAVAHWVLRPFSTLHPLSLILQTAQQRIFRAAHWFTVGAIMVGFGLLAWQIKILLETLPDGATKLTVAWQIMSRTRWGVLWDVRQVMLLLVLASLSMLRPFPLNRLPSRIQVAWGIAALFIVTAVITQSMMGHAAAIVPGTAVSVAVDSIHLLAALVWIGGMLGLAIGILPMLRHHRDAIHVLLQAGWKPFGRMAAVSVGILFTTGVYTTGQQVASIDALITTLYGQTLLGKIALFLLVGLFGLLNSMLLHPRLAAPLRRLLRGLLRRLLRRQAGWTPFLLRQMPRLLLIELGLGIVVLLLTGLITATAAPRGIEYTVVAEDAPDALSAIIDDVVMTLYAKPNHPGQNVFTIFAASSRRPAPADILRVMVRFNYLEQELGRVTAVAKEVEPGRFLVTGSYFSLPGRWQVDVVVRRSGLEDAIASFEWVVLPATGGQPEIVSKRPLTTPLTILAAILFSCTLITIVVYRFVKRKHAVETDAPEIWMAQLFGITEESSTVSEKGDEENMDADKRR